MNFLYYTNSNLALSRAHVYSILKTAEALGKENGEKTIISAPFSKGGRDESKILKDQMIDKRYVKIANRKKNFIFGVVYLFRVKKEFDVFYYRSPDNIADNIVAFVARILLWKKVYVEVHRLPRTMKETPIRVFSYRISNGIVFITHALRKHAKKFDYKSTVIFCNTYDENLFSLVEGKNVDQLRGELDLPRKKKILTYTGKTFSYSFDTFFEAIKGIPNTAVVIVGVTNEDVFRKKAHELGVLDRLILRRRVPKKEIPKYLRAADILFIPDGLEEPGYFPVKIFDYLGVGKPIVSFTNECIKEVLKHEINSILVPEKTSDSWREALQRLISENELGQKISRNAVRESVEYTWQKKAQNLLNFIEKNGNSISNKRR